MNIKSILRSIRFLALLIGNMMMAGCSNSNKPAYLEPNRGYPQRISYHRGRNRNAETPVQIRHFGEHEPQY